MRSLCFIIIHLILLLSLSCGISPAEEFIDPFPEASSSYLLQVDGQILYAHKPNKRQPPASLTKIMTAMLALRHTRLDEVVTISRDASAETGGRLGLESGERMYAGFLLAATLIQSANDACRALADHVAGNEAGFVNMMNDEAKTMGMQGTHFTNACGHDNPEHYSTARDLLVLTEAALKVKELADIVSIAILDISTKGGGRVFHLENRNELIGRYQGAIGVKTGFTPNGGKCIIALAERNGTKVLLVLLNAPDRWWDAEIMLDAAFTKANH